MDVFIRTDASQSIGYGHVMRCLTLAQSLREQNLQSTFLCREDVGNLCSHIEAQGFSVIRLPLLQASEFNKTLQNRAASLKAIQIEDARLTRAAILQTDTRPKWLIVDHYALDECWEIKLRPIVNKLMVVDDLADRNHDCDVLLDQNFYANSQTRYINKVPAHCISLLGTNFSLLQPIYKDLRKTVKPRSGSIRRIFTFFGGGDNDNLTGRTLNAFLRLNRSDIQLDIVLASNNPNYLALKENITGLQNVCLHGLLPSLGPLMASADLAIGAGGATHWERLCLGLPSVVISLADNQKQVSIDLAAAGLISYLGHKDQVNEELIYKELLTLVHIPISNVWSESCYAICDGQGAERVTQIMMGILA